MRNRHHRRKNKNDAVEAKPLQVTIEQAKGDTTRLIKKFMKKVRKEEVLKPFYGRLMYHETKSQKRRKKNAKAAFFARKRQRELDEL